jgi:hypothetical protein
MATSDPFGGVPAFRCGIVVLNPAVLQLEPSDGVSVSDYGMATVRFGGGFAEINMALAPWPAQVIEPITPSIR